ATADELEDGVACVDLGGGVTSLAMFLRGDLVFADLVRAGGAHVTLDVARRLSLTVAEAERLKTLEGSASALDAGSESEVELTREARRLRGGEPITRAELCAVVRPRVEDTLRLARDRLAQAGFFHLPTRRVVLTGGGAELGGLLHAAREVFGPHVRLGRPIHLRGLPAECAGPAYAAAAGLAQYALNADQEVWDQVKMPKAAARGGLGGFWRWLKDAW
ncbi:MAG: cell division FtsA domain-containing protein, partial [Pseudomonadota bacterium]